MNCDNCGASTSNGLALCQACRAWFLVNTEFIPVYYRNLARWRPSQATGAKRAKQTAPAMPTLGGQGTDRIGRILEETHTDILRLTEHLTEDRPQHTRVIARINRLDEEATVALTCALLTKYVDSLTTLSWIKDIVTGIGEIEQVLREETERSMPGWYAGACTLCGVPTHVVPGLTWVTCGGCGATTYAKDHLGVILNEAREWVSTPGGVAVALVALLDDEDSILRLRKRITNWGNRDQIETHRRLDEDGDPVGVKRYRLGDVLDALDGERRKVS